MIMEANLLGHVRAFAMYADRGDRIAKGEVPPAPQGIERNVGGDGV
jgi:hypothetical protein